MTPIIRMNCHGNPMMVAACAMISSPLKFIMRSLIELSFLSPSWPRYGRLMTMGGSRVRKNDSSSEMGLRNGGTARTSVPFVGYEN